MEQNVFDVLKERGFIEQTTHEAEIRELLGKEKVTFYIGFDATADSLTAGHFLTIMAMMHMQRAGHRPIALLGGGTTMIGDPSGKSDMRNMMTKEKIDYNAKRFHEQLSRFIDFDNDKAIIANNADWLLDLNYVEFLREIGVHFSVKQNADCRVLQTENGKRTDVLRVQLHADAVLRFPETEPAVRLPDGAWRKRPVVQHSGRC